jgi:hypothetical protein
MGRRELAPRLPHAGEIRTGEKRTSKAGKQYPARLDKFRITGPEHAVRSVADVYGGEPRPWTDGPTPGSWEVYTEADTLHVAVPVDSDDALDAGHFELWSGGGRIRRCDGTTCRVSRVEGEGDKARIAYTETTCMCTGDPDARDECQPVTRLRVLLPYVEGVGVWRLHTGSVFAAMELAGTVGVLRMGGARGLVPAYLRIAQRQQKRHGLPTRSFPVPVLEPQVQSARLIGPGVFRDQIAKANDARLLEESRQQEMQALEAVAGGDSEQAMADRLAAQRLDEIVALAGHKNRAVEVLRTLGVTDRYGLLDDDVMDKARKSLSPQAGGRREPDDPRPPAVPEGQTTLQGAA